MRTISTQYHSFLLRLWRDDFEGDWRASLQDVKSGECFYFASMDAMVEFMMRKTKEPQRMPHLIHERAIPEPA